MKPSKFDPSAEGFVTTTTLNPGEQQTIAASDGGRVSVIPGATHYIKVEAGQTVVIAPPGGAGGINNYILAAAFEVTNAATSAVTATDGTGLDGAASAWPLLAANTPAGLYEKDWGSLYRSKNGAWTVTFGAGVRGMLAVIA